MRSFRLYMFLLVSAGMCTFFSSAAVSTIFIQIPAENVSDSSPQFPLPFRWQSGKDLKPVILITGGGDGYDGHDHWYGGGSPQIPILMFGNVPPSRSKAGEQGSSSGTASGSASDKDQSPEKQPAVRPQDRQGAGNTPPTDSEMDSMLAEAMSMLDTLDVLFESSDVIITLLLDLDGTILARDDKGRELQKALRERFKIFVERWRSQGRLRLVIITGAGLREGAEAFFRTHQLPLPDVMVANPVAWNAYYHIEFFGEISSGTLLPQQPIVSGIHVTGRSLTIDNYTQFHMTVASQLPQWLQQRNLGTATVQTNLQGDNIVHELSFSGGQDFASEHWTSSIRQLVFDLCGILAKVEFDDATGVVKVILPMTKGGTVSHLASVLPLAGAQLIAAGDDRIDRSMLLPEPGVGFAVYLAIMVSNATRDLRDSVRDILEERLYRAQRPCLLGVIEGLLAAMKKLVPAQDR